MKSTVICVTGWHYPRDFYQALSELESVDIYIVSHRRADKIPTSISEHFSTKQILIRANIGYDWGCYQQFVRTELWRPYQNIIFMHDDLEIHNFKFIRRVNDLLQIYSAVGNGSGEGSVTHVDVAQHPYAYAHSSWKPDHYDFQHKTVRGSFFAVKKEVLEQIQNFEVYWDPWKIDIDFGNWSTKATCGKIEGVFGSQAFGYLSNTFGRSEYITEFIRGQMGGELSQSAGFKAKLYRLIKRISRFYMEIFYQQRDVYLRSFWLLSLKFFLNIFSGINNNNKA